MKCEELLVAIYRGESIELGDVAMKPLIAAAYRHRLAIPLQQLLFRDALAAYSLERPDGSLASFSANHDADLARKAARFGEIRRRLAEDDIPIFALKGAAILERGLAFGKLRPMGDIDFLVRREDVDRSAAILGALGYRRRIVVSRRRGHGELYTRWCPVSDSPLGREELVRGSEPLDIHWDPKYAVCGEVVRLDVEAFWKDPSRADELVAAHLLVHAAHSFAEEGLALGRFLDVAAFPTALGLVRASAKVKRWLMRLSETAEAVGRGDLAPYFAFRREYRVGEPPVFKNSSFHFFRRIGSWKDRGKFLAAYLQS